MQWWFNVRTRAVEAHDDPHRAKAEQLLGPYATEAEAQAALATAAARTEAWDEEDAQEEEWGRS